MRKSGIAYTPRGAWRRNPHSKDSENNVVLARNEGAAYEGRPECVNDTHAEGRYQEVSQAWRYAKCREPKSF